MRGLRERSPASGGVGCLAAEGFPLRSTGRSRVCAPTGTPQVSSVRSLVSIVESFRPEFTTGEGLYGLLSAMFGKAQLITDPAARLASLLDASTGEQI